MTDRSARYTHLLELTARAQAAHFWFRGFRRFVRPLLERAAAGRRDLRLLDCGCGAGHNLPLLAPYGAAFGFDLTPGGLEMAREFGRPLVRSSLAAVPFRRDSIDIAVSFDVLPFVDDDALAVREMARVVKPGGTVMLSAAALESLRGDHSEAWQELRRYDRASVERLFVQAGLDVQYFTYMFASLLPLLFTVRLVQRMLRPYRDMRTDTDISVPAGPINAVLTALVSGEAAIGRAMPIPIGSSILVVGRKR